MSTQISFDGNSLQTANIITQQINHESIPTKDAKLYALAHASKSVIPFVAYPTKTISATGTVIYDTISGLDSGLDTFKGYFTATNANLDIGYEGTTRRYVATVNKLDVSRPRGLTSADFSVDFMLTNPFGIETVSTPILNVAGRTSTPYSDNFTFLGSGPFQYPVFTYTLNSGTGLTASVIIGNNSTGQQITVTRTWSAGDILVIDTYNGTVQVNGVAVAYSGAFPIFAPGIGTLTYSDTFTTRNFDYSVVYTKRWL